MNMTGLYPELVTRVWIINKTGYKNSLLKNPVTIVLT